MPASGPGDNLEWAHGSYRAMSGFCLGEGDHFWDNPRVRNAVDSGLVPEFWRGLMHTVATELGGLQEVQISQVADGLSNTILLGEYHTLTHPRRRTYWAYAYTSYNQSSALLESRTLIPDYDRCVAVGGAGGSESCKRSWGSLHAGGVIQFAYGDGSVRTMTPDIDMLQFAAWSAIADEGAGFEAPPNGDTGGSGR